MYNYLPVIKGIHPGLIIERELKLRKMQKSILAKAIEEHPQTIGSITKAQRNLNTALALKIENFLQLEEGILMVLQIWYDIERVKKKQYNCFPDLSKIRSALFWDTNLKSINWEKQKKAVITRVFERGNENEKNEIIRLYGQQTIREVLAFHGK
jgi:addiction module HigA family antidote